MSAPETENCICLTVPLELAGGRLDAVLAKLLPDYSRSRLTSWIREGAVIVNDKPSQPKDKMIGGEQIRVTIRPSEENLAFVPEPMALDIVYEDDTVIVVNKPAGLVVHPAAGNWTGTLLNGLLAHCPELSQIPRAGIVHRLDKETSGLMVVAKTLPAQNSLVQQLQERTVKRIYRAVANGIVPFDGKIETQIGRDPHNRLKMAVECSLETGRTHQIRVHMREANHPLAADPVYGNLRHPCSDPVKEAVKSLGARQALHAYRLSFVHPKTGETVSFEAPIPDDMYYLLSVLRFEAGLDSSLDNEEEWQDKLGADDDDDWNEDDYDVEVVYVRE